MLVVVALEHFGNSSPGRTRAGVVERSLGGGLCRRNDDQFTTMRDSWVPFPDQCTNPRVPVGLHLCARRRHACVARSRSSSFRSSPLFLCLHRASAPSLSKT